MRERAYTDEKIQQIIEQEEELNDYVNDGWNDMEKRIEKMKKEIDTSKIKIPTSFIKNGIKYKCPDLTTEEWKNYRNGGKIPMRSYKQYCIMAVKEIEMFHATDSMIIKLAAKEFAEKIKAKLEQKSKRKWTWKEMIEFTDGERLPPTECEIGSKHYTLTIRENNVDRECEIVEEKTKWYVKNKEIKNGIEKDNCSLKKGKSRSEKTNQKTLL